MLTERGEPLLVKSDPDKRETEALFQISDAWSCTDLVFSYACY